MAVETFRHWWPPLSIFFAKEKLRGADFDETCDFVIASLQAKR